MSNIDHGHDHDHDHETRLQARAERIEREGLPAADPAVDAYRLVHRAVRRAPLPPVPDGFAARVARQARALDAADRLERRILWGGVAILLAVTAFVAMPALAYSISAVGALLPRAPWAMLGTCAIGLAACALWDAGQRHGRHGPWDRPFPG